MLFYKKCPQSSMINGVEPTKNQRKGALNAITGIANNEIKASFQLMVNKIIEAIVKYNIFSITIA